MSIYVPTWPGLAPRDVLRGRSAVASRPFPFTAQQLAFYYRERNALYHLFRALKRDDADWALVPDYHHGNEVKALRAAGFGIRFYPVGRGLTANLDALVELCKQGPRVLLLIHYLGWPQPLDDILALCRNLDIITVEDCALSLLSEDAGVALGSRADYGLFCLYKTVPVPNGGLLVHNGNGAHPQVTQASVSCGITSLVAHTLNLVIERTRGRSEAIGGPLAAIKARVGRALTRAEIRRWPVGDDGFDLNAVDLRMSRFSQHLLDRFDYRAIRERRRENFARLLVLLAGEATLVREDLAPGICPLFFPILVPDKREAARELWALGIGAVEFWNTGDPAAEGAHDSDAQFLREHVLELPIHQDLRPEHLEYMATTVRGLGLRMAS
jgi:dTDP-4-amino-4,6-dideoxygalactose transaminase